MKENFEKTLKLTRYPGPECFKQQYWTMT